jgi:hypothetical protein
MPVGPLDHSVQRVSASSTPYRPCGCGHGSRCRRQLQSDLSDNALQTNVREGGVQMMHTTGQHREPAPQQGEVRCR